MGGHAATPIPRRLTGGPPRAAVLVLALSALAVVATSPAIPSLQGYRIGEVTLGPDETAERELRIHVDPSAGGATRGTVTVGNQAAHGLGAAYDPNVTVALDRSTELPVEACLEGCDFTYQIAIATGSTVLPGSVIRYDVEVWLQYEGTWTSPPPTALRIDLAGATGAPIAPFWSILAGLVALAVGVLLGPRVHAALPVWRRSWPALALIGLGMAVLGSMIAARAVEFASRDVFTDFGGQASLYVALVDPWAVGLIGTLAWGIRRGTRRWADDGGELLGLAAVAAVGLGGLWLAWWTSAGAAVQPIVLGIVFALAGGLGGIVIGQGWRASRTPIADPWWSTLAVLSHGILIAGFGFLVPFAFYDPFGNGMLGLLALIPILLLAWAYRRWRRGRQGWLAFLDLLIMVTGLLGLFLTSTSFGVSTSPARLEMEDVAVWIAVGASIVAFATALHSRRGLPGNVITPVSIDPEAIRDGPLAIDDPPAT